MKDQPLKIELENERIVISVGISAFAYGVQHADSWDEELKIEDETQFAKDVLRELQREDEQGSTDLFFLFDKAANKAVENGSAAINNLG